MKLYTYHWQLGYPFDLVDLYAVATNVEEARHRVADELREHFDHLGITLADIPQEADNVIAVADLVEVIEHN